MSKKLIKGRGANYNPKNRFEVLSIEEFETDEVDGFLEENEEQKTKTKTIFYKDSSKSIIAKNDSYDLGFDYSINPYRGCEHGCVYCYARPTHEFLGFSAGLDFETKIMVKEDAPELLESVFKKKSYIPKMIMFSGNTDCYQPIERKLEITRRTLQVCLKYKNPAAIITKNSLIQRDADILSEMAKLNLIKVTVSLTSLDKDLIGKMEPRTAQPLRRLKTINLLSQKGIPTGVNIAPLIPGLNDNEIPAILKESASNGALSASYIMLRLPYSVKEIFVNWIEINFPDRASKIINKIKEMRNGKLNESEFGKRFTGEGEQNEAIIKLFKLSCKKYNLNTKKIHLTTELFASNQSNQLEIF